MPSALHATITSLAQKFAADVLHALRGASIGDLTATSPSRASKPRASSKRVRRSSEQLDAFAAKIVAAVATHPDGIRAEDLKRLMGVAPGNVGAKVFTRPMSVALAGKKITKRGQRRATTYHATK